MRLSRTFQALVCLSASISASAYGLPRQSPEEDLTATDTLPIFLAHSTFDGHHEAMLRFFGLLGRQNVESIQHIRHSGHVVLNTLEGIRLTLSILGGPYETMGLRRDALHIPVLIEDEGEIWVNLLESLQVQQVRMGGGLSKMPLVRRVSGSAA